MPQSRPIQSSWARWQTVLFVAAAIAAANPSAAQRVSESTGGELVFRIETALVEVEVHVTDSRGRRITDLKQEDFQLFEDGAPQEIAPVEYIAEPAPEAAPRLSTTATQEETVRRQEAASRRTTRVLIVSHVGPGETSRVKRAIRQFIENKLAPGVLVSLDGAAFTDDKQRLLDLLEGRIAASELPGKPFRADVQAGTDFSEQDQSEQQEQGFGATKEGFSNIIQDQEGRSNLFRYVDLITGLGVYPGKKVLVLFSRGLKLGYSQHQGKLAEGGLFNQRGMFVNLENTDLMHRLRAEAMRTRIQFYVVDARGLNALDQSGTAAHSTLAVENQFRTATPTKKQLKAARMLPRMLSQTAGLGEDSYLSRQGLRMLAEQTDGKAVLNTNDLGVVFDLVNDDLRGYYLVGYYPPERTPGVFRKIEIRMKQPDLKVSHRKGFYDEGTLEEFVDTQEREVAARVAGETASATTDMAPKAALKAYQEALEAIQARPVDVENALESLDRATEMFPEFALAWNLTGYLESVRGNTGEAQAAFETGIAADPSYESPKRHLMRLLADQQDWKKAEAAARGLSELRPGDGEAHYYLAVTQFNQAKFHSAGQAVDAALRAGHGSNYPALLRLKGDILAQQGESAGAAEAYREFLSLEPDSPLAGVMWDQIAEWETRLELLTLGDHLQAGRWGELDRDAAELLAETPDVTPARLYQAFAKFNLGDLDAADRLAQSVRDAPDGEQFPQVYYLLGLVHSEQGDIEVAIREWRGFLELRADSPLAAEVRETIEDWETLLAP